MCSRDAHAGEGVLRASMSTTGWPTTTSSALARVTATLKRLGLRQKPTCASCPPPPVLASAAPPAVFAWGEGGSDSGRASTCSHAHASNQATNQVAARLPTQG